MGIVLPVHPRHYFNTTELKLKWFIRAVQSTLEANGWKHTRTLYLEPDSKTDSDDPDPTPVIDRECWTLGQVKTNNRGVMTGTAGKSVRLKIDWVILVYGKRNTASLRKRLLRHITDTYSPQPI